MINTFRMEHRLWRALKAGKKTQEIERISPFLTTPMKEIGNRGSRDREGKFHGSSNLSSDGLKSSPEHDSYSVMVSSKRTTSYQKKEGQQLRRKIGETALIPSIMQPNNESYYKIHEQNIIYGSSSLHPRQSNTKARNTINTKRSNKVSVSKEPKPLSLPRIPSPQRQRSKSIQARSDAQQLATQLDLIKGRRKSRSFSNHDKSKVPLVFNSKQDSSSFHLDSQLSLPKITIDEVLKSWDVHPGRLPSRKTSSPGRPNPMEFLIRQDMENARVASPAPCYDELKSCRYLRLDKKVEEEASHGRSCPCNSCEHSEGLKESPYLNA